LTDTFFERRRLPADPVPGNPIPTAVFAVPTAPDPVRAMIRRPHPATWHPFVRSSSPAVIARLPRVTSMWRSGPCFNNGSGRCHTYVDARSGLDRRYPKQPSQQTGGAESQPLFAHHALQWPRSDRVRDECQIRDQSPRGRAVTIDAHTGAQAQEERDLKVGQDNFARIAF
jgi:hypothetical protein